MCTFVGITNNTTVDNAALLLIHKETFLPRFLAATPYLLMLLSLAATVTNSVVLVAFIANRRLRTPFNCYLISLLLSDIGQAALDLPFTVLGEFQPVWSLGRAACNFNLYGKWVFTAAVRNTHALISLNRIWALFGPLSYKQYHTTKLAVWLCVGTWVYVHLWLLPGMVPDAMVPDAMGFRRDDGTCFVNTTAQPVWALTTQMCLYNSTLVIIVITYPFIWWKIRQRHKISPCRNERVTKLAPPLVADKAPYHSIQPFPCGNVPSTEVPSNKHDTAPNVDEVEDVADKQLAKPGSHATGHQKPSSCFTVLTYLVAGVIICWTPIMVFFTVADFMDYNNNLHFVIGSLLYYLNSLLDPIFFCIAIRPLRSAVFNLFHR